MKITQDEEFKPITVVFETEEEAKALADFIGHQSPSQRMDEGQITKQQDNIVQSLWDQIDDLLRQ